MLSFFKLISLKRKERSYRVSLVAAAMLMVCFSFRQVPFLEMTVFTGSKSVVVGVRNEQTATLYATGPFRKGASSGWVNRYGAKVIEVTGDTLLPSPFFFWTKGNEFGVEHLLFSENLAQKKSVAWDGVVVRQKRTWNSWELVVPYERCLAETIVTYGKASCFRFNSDGLPVGECNQHSFPIGTAHSKEE